MKKSKTKVQKIKPPEVTSNDKRINDFWRRISREDGLDAPDPRLLAWDKARRGAERQWIKKPCECGSRNITMMGDLPRWMRVDPDDGPRFYYAKCDFCGATGLPELTIELAWHSWNTEKHSKQKGEA